VVGCDRAAIYAAPPRCQAHALRDRLAAVATSLPRRRRNGNRASRIDTSAAAGAPFARSTCMDTSDALRAKARLVHDRLCAEYGCPIPYFHDLDPLSELVSSLLSHRTRNSDSGRAFRQLRARFPTWEAVRDAPTAEVEEAIAHATWPEQKAPRIQAVLREIDTRRGGDLSLDFLGDLPVEEARQWLETLHGVGPKTSAAVLLFSRLRMPALPVDSHHHRVAQRLALIPDDMPVGPSHRLLEAQLPPEWTAQQVYDNHEALMLHGQRCCFFRDPACHRCPVLDLCPFGQHRMRGQSAGIATASRPSDE
jgi:endonuclease-3